MMVAHKHDSSEKRQGRQQSRCVSCKVHSCHGERGIISVLLSMVDGGIMNNVQILFIWVAILLSLSSSWQPTVLAFSIPDQNCPFLFSRTNPTNAFESFSFVSKFGDINTRQGPSRTLTLSLSLSTTNIQNENEDNQGNNQTTTTTTTTTTASSLSSSSSLLSEKGDANAATVAFNNKLNELSRNYNKGTAQKVQDVLMEMIHRVETGQESNVKPNVVSWTAAINAWARSPDMNAAQKAEVLFQQMQKEPHHIVPNSYTFNAIITAWVRSREKGSAFRAEEKLHQMWDLYYETMNQSKNVNHDKKSHNNNHDDNSSSNPSSSVLLVRPDAQAYNRVINAIARSREPNCAHKATVLLGKMEELCTVQGYTDMEPDAKTFGAIINAHANSGTADASDKAAELLQRMESLYQLGYTKVKPNTFVYNACMNAFAKSIVERKNDHDNINIDNHKREDGEIKAEQILNLMEKMYKEQGDGSVKPDVISYSTMINAIANSGSVGAGERAEHILQRMIQLYLTSGDEKVKPNAITMTAVIKAWTSSLSSSSSCSNDKEEKDKDENHNVRAADKSQEVLERMCMLFLAGDRSMKPTKVTFDLVYEAFVKIQDEERMDWLNQVRQTILDNNNNNNNNSNSRRKHQHPPKRQQQ